MQSNKQVLRAMVESEEVSLQATAEAGEGFSQSHGITWKQSHVSM